MNKLVILLAFALLTACQRASSVSPLPIAAGVLVHEYEQSSAAVRRRYDGKEIIVRGYTETIAVMPGTGVDQGSVMLREKDSKPNRALACWFSTEQVNKFSKIKGGQYLTVKGVFTGEAGADLKFCKLLRIE